MNLALLFLTILLAPAPDVRAFTFTYAAEVSGLPPGKTVRIWTPVPPSTDEQTIEVLERRAPGRSRLTRDPEYGNGIWYVEAPVDATGSIRLVARYRVVRRAVTPEIAVGGNTARLLQPDRFVPVGGKRLTLLAGMALPAGARDRARALSDLVFEHMTYGKDVAGWGRGDATWACDSRTGNCSDFHSLFISLARSQQLPARFEVGFGLPVARGKGEIGGYHCWAKVWAEGQWLPFDISEPNKLGANRDDYFGKLPPNRVAFSTGRDVPLEPPPASGPVNFFIYPHVEVDGKQHPGEKIQGTFRFADE
jgi:transglutaminase-like putative cysteine protease